MESNMKVTPIISILMTNEETKNDQLVKDIFIQLKLNYLEKIMNFSRFYMHKNLEFRHYFSIYILKENDKYRVITCKSHIHEVYIAGKHYGDAFIIDDNNNKSKNKNSMSIYEGMFMDKEYQNIDISKIIFDFNQLFKDVEKEKISLEIRLV